MINETRAAEAGSTIITDTAEHAFGAAIALKALETTVINTLGTTVDKPTVGISYFDGYTLYAGDTIEANMSTVQLTSGAVQVFNRP